MALLERLMAGAEMAVEHRRRQVEAAWAAVAGIKVDHEGDRLVISGRGLMQRRLRDPRLRLARWIGA